MPNKRTPFAEKLFRGIGHLCFFAGAIYSGFLQAPKQMIIYADPIQIGAWVFFLATGVIAAVACWREKYLIEYACIPFMAGGAAIYLAASIAAVTRDASPGSGFAMILAATVISYLTARWFSVNQLLDGPLKLLFKRRTGSDE